MTASFLPYGRQLIEDDDIAAVVALLKSDMLTTGPAGPAFEAAFAAATSASHAVACSNGTAALHLAALALGLGPGTCAIVPSITFLATANAVRLCGAEVVFADVDPSNGLMTPQTCADAIGRAGMPVGAIFVVHLGGQTADMPGLAALARKHGIPLVEDACHALGTAYGGDGGAEHRIGSCAHSVMATFSLHPVKTIAAGEGGVVTTTDARLARRMALLRNHGMHREGPFVGALSKNADGSVPAWYYEMPEPGFNYRLSDIQAALATSQLSKLPRFAERRRALALRYEKLLAKFNSVRPVARTAGCSPVWHLFQVSCDFDAIGMDRQTLMARLRSQGIGTQVHYVPVHRQPYYADRYPQLDLPGADTFYQGTLSLPLFAAMGEEEVDRVIAALERSLAPNSV